MEFPPPELVGLDYGQYYCSNDSNQNQPPETIPEEYRYFFSKEQLDEIFPFTSRFVRKLFKNAYVLFVGDSLLRAQYKDLVCMLQTDDLCTQVQLKRLNETKFMGDVQTGQNKVAFNGPLTDNAREYCTDAHLVRYKFASRCLNRGVEKLICSLLREPPDVLFMNSCLWDVSRYGMAKDGCTAAFDSNGARRHEDEKSGLEQYADRMSRLMRMLHDVLPEKTMVVWVTTPPVRPSKSESVNQFNTNEYTGSLVEQGNYIAAQIVRAAGYDVADVNFVLRVPLFNRFQTKDGVHWFPEAVRLVTQLLVGQVAASWQFHMDAKTASRLRKMDVDTSGGMQIFGDFMIQNNLCISGTPGFFEEQDGYFRAILNTGEGKNMVNEISTMRYIQHCQENYEKAVGKKLTRKDVWYASEKFLYELITMVPKDKPPVASFIGRMISHKKDRKKESKSDNNENRKSSKKDNKRPHEEDKHTVDAASSSKRRIV